jgi:hypothetical protein
LRKFSNSVATCVCPPPGWNSCCIIGMKASGARKAFAPPLCSEREPCALRAAAAVRSHPHAHLHPG